MANEDLPQSLRLFIAIELPEKIRAAITAAQTECIKRLPAPGLKWAPPEQFHLTLRFLGSLDSTQLPDLTTRLRKACGDLKPLDLKCAGFGLFPERGRPRVFWVGVHDDGGKDLDRTFRAVTEATAGFGQQEEPEKHFTGHITLARCKEIDRATTAKVRELVRDFSNREFGSWQATEVNIMRSELLPKGAIHSVLERIRLGKN